MRCHDGNLMWPFEIDSSCTTAHIRPGWGGDFTMKRIRHTAVLKGLSEGVQLIRKLKTAVQLKTVADVERPW